MMLDTSDSAPSWEAAIEEIEESTATSKQRDIKALDKIVAEATENRKPENAEVN